VLKKLLFLSSVVALCAFQARTSQLAFIALHFDSPTSSSLPSGWQPKITHGKPDYSVIRESDGTALRLRSNRASFGLERGVDVDPDAMPWLTWRWKAVQIPAGGDFRKSRTDDQAAQVLVAFSDRRVITYLWDSTAPKDTMQSASSIPLVHIFAVVCRSGQAELNQWLSEARNVAEDYQRAYGRRPPRVKGLRLQINSQHTGTTAESWFGHVAFRSTPQ
jgi:hypothetical protein